MASVIDAEKVGKVLSVYRAKSEAERKRRASSLVGVGTVQLGQKRSVKLSAKREILLEILGVGECRGGVLKLQLTKGCVRLCKSLEVGREREGKRSAKLKAERGLAAVSLRLDRKSVV